MPKETKIVIVGAGASGIAAASRLLKRGMSDFVILEAKDRIGGRINTKDFVRMWWISALIGSLELKTWCLILLPNIIC
ncbi:Peroxisomal N(1)-acetyl-spermine/spermidine oxidase [Temnothorax longispinosus]|uniref:Peroxisomal N(1)-acetyl-spermine/spermidine oxidase n=1 Tax=Temnothorax longispinosus TaxID=300112 RepID=A0A4V3S7R9_9HYME|nr:Peroxisomal N(1)-acetyl-spermine/spermidine oxidase [Temnothorax longispinosus]